VNDLQPAAVDLERIRTLRIISMIIVGFAVGFMSGLLGIGGGTVMVPALVYLYGLSQHRAHGTSLAFMFPVALYTSIFYAIYGQVDWLVALELMIGSVVGAAIGARICARVSARRLRAYFGIFLAGVGARMLWDIRAALALTQHNPVIMGHMLSTHEPLGILVIIVTGIATGVLSGFFGVGGGVVMIPALSLLLGYPQTVAQGISLAVIVPTSVAGSLIHTKHGNVNWTMAIWLAIGGIGGGWVGARLANVVISESVLRAIFGMLMLVMGLLMVRRSITQTGALA